MEITQIINLGVLPFTLYMAWLFWSALQKSNDRYGEMIERLMMVIENNSRAIRDAEQRSADLDEKLERHDQRAERMERMFDSFVMARREDDKNAKR